jgi:hypothetical protein
MPNISNWVVGFFLCTVGVLKLLWGADLVVVSLVLARSARVRLVVDGSFWLGCHFMTSGIFIYLLFGVFLLNEPLKPAPFWFALPIIAAGIEAGMAWKFLSDERRQG